MNEAIPAGYCRRADGSLVPQTMVKPIDQLRDQTIARIVEGAKKLNAEIAAFKGQMFSDIEEFIATSFDQYQVRVGGAKGNVTLMSFDGRFKVIRHVQDRLVFDERLQAAQSLIEECLGQWTKESRDEIKVIIKDAFQVDKEGKISTGRVLGLRRLPIKDPTWERAMQAISDSVQVMGSKPYVRVYERVADSDEYRHISLDLASV